uniref:CXXC motif containing zinc binding protein n=1 Tax=Sinocyclocheilus rhinocerous TaxID=307959 RepID=A0A673MSV6_9TELE
MGKFGLQFKASLGNVTNVRPVGDDFRWYLKLKCGNCGEVSDKWQYITLLDSMPLKGGRGSASMVQKCKLCSRENSIDILRDTITPYNAEDSERYKTILQFECRGLEPVDFQPQAGFAASGAETSSQFPEINLQEKVRKKRNSHIISHLLVHSGAHKSLFYMFQDWTDYDEKASESVGIYEVTHQFIKC